MSDIGRAVLMLAGGIAMLGGSAALLGGWTAGLAIVCWVAGSLTIGLGLIALLGAAK